MTELSTLAPDFVEAAHAIVYCSVAPSTGRADRGLV